MTTEAAYAVAEQPDLVWRCWDGELVVYRVRSGAIHHLEGVPAALFIELADGGPRPEGVLADWLAAAADMPVEQVRNPLAASLETLTRCQLIAPLPKA